MPHGRLYKSKHSAWNAWKTPNFCGSHIPYPGHFGRCRRLEWITRKDHDAMLAGTRHASFMVCLLPNLFGRPTPKQPRGWLCNFSQSLIISAVRFCLICGKHITCEVPREYRARDSACFGITLFSYYSVTLFPRLRVTVYFITYINVYKFLYPARNIIPMHIYRYYIVVGIFFNTISVLCYVSFLWNALYNFSTTVCFITPILFLFCRFPLLHGGPPQNVLLHHIFLLGDPAKTRIFRNFSPRFPFQNLAFTPKNPHFFAKKVVLHRYTIHTSHRCWKKKWGIFWGYLEIEVGKNVLKPLALSPLRRQIET